ncbi:WD40-repeat-containing domain protein [Apodospora peruviana]|uniref:WD40-repeat-containing domain protein n=1 Tax=Apodospora peruviana TaxID=516989 RepID=A0AAE0IH99_9PEZI|nr:WD40-repeat-containing domain protein [Apodospora peruviana]
MNQLLFEQSTGNISPNVFARLETTKLLSSFRPAPRFRFDGGERPVAVAGSSSAAAPGSSQSEAGGGTDSSSSTSIWAHQAGVNVLALERLISGGIDATIKIWDLEQCSNPTPPHTYRPVATISRAEQPASSPNTTANRRLGGGSTSYTTPKPPPGAGHRFGITHLSFYPFDSDAFLSCSYDQTLKLWSTATARVSGSFDLGAKVYTHAVSPIASHLLVACGTQHPAVRLVDLRSAAAVQSLISPGQIGGSAGATLAVAWSPVHEHVLASGAVDGAVRIWDVRRSNGLVGLLDMEDSLGILHPGRAPPAGTAESLLQSRGVRQSARAHNGPVNGLTWTDDGAYIVSAGHDRKIRVWDAATGANTLANFGPTIRNSHIGSLGSSMFVSPLGLTRAKKELLFFPNETEILVMDLHEGDIVSRLRGMGPGMAALRTGRAGGERAVKNRLTSVVWKGAGGGGSSSGHVMGGRNAAGGIYSGHLDGQIRAWMPRLEGLDEEDEDNSTQEAAEVRTKKRKALDDAFKSLMGRQVTFN